MAGRARFDFGKAAEAQVRAARFQLVSHRVRRCGALEQGDAVPAQFKRSRQPQPPRVGGQLSGQVAEDCFVFFGRHADHNVQRLPRALGGFDFELGRNDGE